MHLNVRSFQIKMLIFMLLFDRETANEEIEQLKIDSENQEQKILNLETEKYFCYSLFIICKKKKLQKFFLTHIYLKKRIVHGLIGVCSKILKHRLQIINIDEARVKNWCLLVCVSDAIK